MTQNPFTPEALADQSEDYESGLISAHEFRQWLVMFALNTTEDYLTIIAGKLSPDELSDPEKPDTE